MGEPQAFPQNKFQAKPIVIEEERDMVTEYRQHSWISRHAMQELPREGRLWQVLSNVSTCFDDCKLRSKYLQPGCISLSLPNDDDVLSPLHCFMRRYCVEAFSATTDDVATPSYSKSHGVKVLVGLVGIRCLYCKQRPVGKLPERYVCYTSSLRNIYHYIETWQRRHSLVCSDITRG